MLFTNLNLCPEILRAIEDMGYTEATEIQGQTIPLILDGEDVIGKSSTGTGKTAAFALPLIEMCMQNSSKGQVLVLSPTRELAMQIAEEVRKFSKYVHGISIATVYGGASMDTQIRALKTAKIVIGTPGRIMDHLRRKTLKLGSLRAVVLDEADEMLNMGFVDDIRTILETAPENRQTILFSATMPKAILDITKQFQRDPKLVDVKTSARTAEGIDQSFYNIAQPCKLDALKLLLEFHKPARSLVFCNTKKMVDELASDLGRAGFKAVGIHGDLKQNQRQIVMEQFKSGRAKVLIATDVAARGIDVQNVEAVFNYDIPQEYEYYIHRIGRTARAGQKGASFTLVCNRPQLMRLKEIERYVHATIEERPVPSLESIATQRQSRFADELLELVGDGVDEGWREFVNEISAQGIDPLDLAAVLCAKSQRKGSKRLVDVRNVQTVGGGKKPAPRGRSMSADSGKAWVRVNVGKNNRVKPNFLAGALVEGADLDKRSVGKINIFADYTDIELPTEDANTVLKTMQNAKICGTKVSFVQVPSSKDDGYERRDFRDGAKDRGGYKGGKGRFDKSDSGKSFSKRQPPRKKYRD